MNLDHTNTTDIVSNTGSNLGSSTRAGIISISVIKRFAQTYQDPVELVFDSVKALWGRGVHHEADGVAAVRIASPAVPVLLLGCGCRS